RITAKGLCEALNSARRSGSCRGCSVRPEANLVFPSIRSCFASIGVMLVVFVAWAGACGVASAPACGVVHAAKPAHSVTSEMPAKTRVRRTSARRTVSTRRNRAVASFRQFGLAGSISILSMGHAARPTVGRRLSSSDVSWWLEQRSCRIWHGDHGLAPHRSVPIQDLLALALVFRVADQTLCLCRVEV